MPHTITRAGLEDAPGILAVLRDTWLDSYDATYGMRSIERLMRGWDAEESIVARILDPALFFAVARTDSGRVIGVVTAKVVRKTTLVIHRLYVSPRQQRKGLGSALLSTLMAAHPKTKKIRLQVLERSPKGVAFWKRHGFAETGMTSEVVAGERVRHIEMEKRLERTN